MAKNAIAKIIADADTFVFELPDIADEAESSLTYEQAYDEVIASSLESVLNDGNVMDLLDTIETKDKSLWEQIRSFVEDFAALMLRTVRAFRNVHPESLEGRIVERMTEIHAQLQQAFAEGLHEAGENYRTGGKENTADNSGVKYSYIQLSDADRQSGEVVANFIDAVNSMMDAAKKSKRKKKIGVVSKNHADIINSLMQSINPSFSAEGYELWIDGTGATHIEERHGVQGAADHTMATYEAKALIPWASQNATTGAFLYDANGNIKLSTRYFNSDNSRAPEIRLEKELGDDVVYISECVPDSNNKRIWITSAYIKKGSRGQLLNMEDIPSPQHTPKASFDSTATNFSIATDDETVKKFSARYQQNEAAAQHLQQENSRMTEDVAALTPLVQALRKMNGGKMRTAYLAEAVAHLKKIAGARGNSAELGALRTIKKILSRFCVCLCTLVDFSEVSAKADVK